MICSSLWGGDVTTFVRQANAYTPRTTVIGTTLYSAAGDVPGDALAGTEIYSGSRNYYWGKPALGNWQPGRELFDAATQQEGVTVPTAHYMAGTGRSPPGQRPSRRPSTCWAPIRLGADRAGAGGPGSSRRPATQHRRGPSGASNSFAAMV